LRQWSLSESLKEGTRRRRGGENNVKVIGVGNEEDYPKKLACENGEDRCVGGRDAFDVPHVQHEGLNFSRGRRGKEEYNESGAREVEDG